MCYAPELESPSYYDDDERDIEIIANRLLANDICITISEKYDYNDTLQRASDDNISIEEASLLISKEIYKDVYYYEAS